MTTIDSPQPLAAADLERIASLSRRLVEQDPANAPVSRIVLERIAADQERLGATQHDLLPLRPRDISIGHDG